MVQSAEDPRLLLQEVSLGRLLSDEPLFTVAGLVLFGLCLPFLAGYGLDTRQVDGANPWVKPLKFGLSLGLFFLTLAVFARFLPEGMTAAGGYRAYAWLIILCAAAEMIWISGAALAGTRSHFNTEIPFMAAIYGVMGLIAIVLTSVTVVYGVAIWRAAGGAPLLQLVALGLILTFVLTVPVAGFLASSAGPHVTAPPPDGGKMWLMGWSREVGDLRVAHFFATHALQFLPLIGLLVLWLPGPGLSTGGILALGVGYSALVGATLAQALAGRPFLPWLG